MTEPTIANDLLRFVQDVLVRRIPARDIDRAEQIGLQARQMHPEGVPEDVRCAWLSPIVQALGSNVEQWDKAIGMVALYLDEQIPSPKGHLSLASTLTQALMAAEPGVRAEFFTGLDDWSAMRALEPLIPSLDLDRQTALALVNKWLAPQEPGVISGLSARAIGAWAGQHPVLAKEMVESWLAAQPEQRPFSSGALTVLVEGVVQAAVTREQCLKSLAWRDRVLAELGGSMAEADHRLAAYLVFWAWPIATLPLARHEALLEFLRRSPVQLASVGLQALMRVMQDQSHTLLAVDTLVRISLLVRRAQPDPSRWQQHLRETAHVLWMGLGDAVSTKPELTRLEFLLTLLLELKPGNREEMRPLDYLVAYLWKLYPEQVADWMTQWLRRHAAQLSGRLEVTFPLLAGHRQGPMDRWLVGWLVDPVVEVRTYAARVMGHQEVPSLDMAAIKTLKTSQAQALVHMVLSAHLQPEPLMNLLGQLASRRSDLVELIGETLRDELAVDYVGATRKWVERIASQKDAPLGLKAVARQVQEQYAQRDKLLAERVDLLPELRGTWPTLRETLAAQQELISRAMDEHKSPLMELATRQPIARGSRSAGPSGSPSEFQYYEDRFEMSARSILDPVTAQLLPIQHRQRATELLQDQDG